MRYIPHRLSISSVLQKILNDSIKPEIMGVVGGFILPLVSAVLLVVLIVQIGRTWRDYRDHGEIEYIKPLVIGVCLLVTSVANGFMWAIIGW